MSPKSQIITRNAILGQCFVILDFFKYIIRHICFPYGNNRQYKHLANAGKYK